MQIRETATSIDVQVDGEIDANTADRLSRRLQSAVSLAAEHGRLTVDLTRVLFIDATGVGAAEQTLPLVTDRSRQAVRRMMDAAADAATEAAAHLAIPDPRAERLHRRDTGGSRPVEQAAADAAAAAVRAAADSVAEKDAAEPPPRPSTTEPKADPE